MNRIHGALPQEKKRKKIEMGSDFCVNLGEGVPSPVMARSSLSAINIAFSSALSNQICLSFQLFLTLVLHQVVTLLRPMQSERFILG